VNRSDCTNGIYDTCGVRLVIKIIRLLHGLIPIDGIAQNKNQKINT
jgi:hypothetical protein